MKYLSFFYFRIFIFWVMVFFPLFRHLLFFLCMIFFTETSSLRCVKYFMFIYLNLFEIPIITVKFEFLIIFYCTNSLSIFHLFFGFTFRFLMIMRCIYFMIMRCIYFDLKSESCLESKYEFKSWFKFVFKFHRRVCEWRLD